MPLSMTAQVRVLQFMSNNRRAASAFTAMVDRHTDTEASRFRVTDQTGGGLTSSGGCRSVTRSAHAWTIALPVDRSFSTSGITLCDGADGADNFHHPEHLRIDVFD